MEEKDTNKQPENNPGDPKESKKGINFPKTPKFNIYWVYGIIAIIFIAMQYLSMPDGPKKISFQEFEKKLLIKSHVKKIIVVNQKFAEIYINPDSLSKVDTSLVKDPAKANKVGPHVVVEFLNIQEFDKRLNDAQQAIITRDTAGIKDPVAIQKVLNRPQVIVTSEERVNWMDQLLQWVIPIAIFIGFWFFLMRRMGGGAGGGQIFNFGKSKANLYDKNTSISITFENVAGLQEAKVEVMEIVDFLKNPKKYTDLGGKIPRGALLVGPPGTGKTLLAKAVAGEAQVPFFSISGSDFVEMFVGVGASRVRDLFRQAKEKSPCIIFIDEIDAIGRARGRSQISGGNDERENTLNQLLTEMDGFSPNMGVIILAATNRADILDKALLRAGRFDRQIHVELPDLDERKAIFNVHLKPLKFDSDSVHTEFLSKQTPGFSGADIANVCNEAALIAARRNKATIDKQDFLDAIDRIVGGLEKKNKIITLKEKRAIAYHEMGHATISWMLKYAHPLVKVTIVPRGNALGAAWYLPEERSLTTKEQMLDEITATLGGRAAEEVFLGEISTGALNDLERVTKQASSMVVYFGLNEKIGNVSFYDSTGQSEYSFGKPYSEKTAQVIDEEVKNTIEFCYNRAKEILVANQNNVHVLAERLLSKEVIFREDLEDIFGKRPFEEDEKVKRPADENENGTETETTTVSEEVKS